MANWNDQMELSIKLENLFLEKHRTTMKFQLAQSELNDFMKQKPQLEEDMRKLTSTQRELIESISKALAIVNYPKISILLKRAHFFSTTKKAADRENDIKDTVQVTNRIKEILNDSLQAHEILSKKVEELKVCFQQFYDFCLKIFSVFFFFLQFISGAIDPMVKSPQKLDPKTIQEIDKTVKSMQSLMKQLEVTCILHLKMI